MKRFVKRLTALALVLALAAGAMGQTALASQALGTELVDRTAQLAQGVTFTSQSLWSPSNSDLRTENYITYTPGGGVTPLVYSGIYVTSRNTVAAAASELEKQGRRVIAGINGGFFNSDGTIVGMLMTEGVVRSLDLYNHTMLGFTRDGEVFIDESRITKTVSWESENASGRYNLAGFNAYRNNDALGGLYLYNQDFSSKVNCDAGRGYVAVLLSTVPVEEEPGDDGGEPEDGDLTSDPDGEEPEDGDVTSDPDAEEPEDGDVTSDPDGKEPGDDELTPACDGRVIMNGALTLWVEEVMDSKDGDTFGGKLPKERYLLYANYYNGNDSMLSGLRSLTPGQQVTVTVSSVSERWADAAYGVSGMYTLLRGGKVVSGLPSAVNPYTAVGVREDGTAVFYTIDGRQSGYSVGATYEQMAQRLRELGCVTAVALDGGGSTVLGATLPGQRKFGLLNRPSQADRALNNSIFLVAEDEYAGMDPGFSLSSNTQVVLAGAALNVSAVGYDQWGAAASGMTPDWSATGGTIEGDGLAAVYTAGDTAGTYAVSAGSGSELPVRVVSELSRLTVTGSGGAAMSSLSLLAQDTVDLSVSGRWYNLKVAMGDEDVTWAVKGDIGTIDSQGRFTAGNIGGSGEITASAGGKTAAVSVTVEHTCPFTDIEDHWSADYVVRLYGLGITQGIEQADGTFVYNPSGRLSRGEMLVFITRLLHVDTEEFQDVTLPFADTDAIPQWMLPSIKAMYALGVLNGGSSEGKLYADVNNGVNREEAMTMLGRILAARESQDLSGFADSGSVSDWARPYVETLVALNVVQGSGGMLNPRSEITRGEVAKLLVEIDGLEKAELTPRPSGPEVDDPEPQEPDEPGDTPDEPGDTSDEPGGTLVDPDQPGEDEGDPVSTDEPSADPLG